MTINNYVPTLAVRASEMNGLEYLPGVTKERMTPCFLLAPWANSKKLDKAIDRIQKAYKGRKFFLDIDRDYQITNMDSEPQKELISLQDSTKSYRNWMNFVEKFQNVMPCIQTKGLSATEIREQIQFFQKIKRTYSIRIEMNKFPANFDEIVEAFSASGTADFVIHLEGGWVRDPLMLEVWFSGVISRNLFEINAQVPIILSCTSIPKEFSNISGIKDVPFNNRKLFNILTQGSNHSNFLYGDWGSTRPRESSIIFRKPLDRIDYPVKDTWYIARNKEAEWNFQDAAREIINKKKIWVGDLNIWGEQMIKQTKNSKEVGINTPQKNVATRVNIHLHLQAFYDDEKIMKTLNFDDEWED